MIREDIYNNSNYTLFDIKEDINELTSLITETTEWYESKFNNQGIENIFNNNLNLKEGILNLNKDITFQKENFIKNCASDFKEYIIDDKQTELKESILNLIMYNFYYK